MSGDGGRGDTAIVVGAGMAGIHAIAALLKAGIPTTVIEPTGHHQFLTRLAAVAGGTQPTRDAAVPLDVMFPSVDLVTARLRSLQDTVIELDDGTTRSADAVIITAGAEPATAPIDGLSTAQPLRSAADAMAIRRALEISQEVMVVGGGATGVQLAGAIAVARPATHRVTLIDRQDRLLSGFAPSLGRHAAKILDDRGVDLRTGAEVDRIDDDGLQLSSGQRLDGMVVWAGGFEAAFDRLGDVVDGRLTIDRFGRLPDRQTVFAAGDAAAHLDRNGELRPMSAQIAAQAGRAVAGNVVRTLAGRAPKPIDLNDLGWVVDLGGGRGVAELLGIRLASAPIDRLVPILHDLIDVRNLFQIGGLSFVSRFGPGRGPGHRLGHQGRSETVPTGSTTG